MQANSKKPTYNEMKALIDGIVSECKLIAKNYVKNWKPIDNDWPTIEGCAYLRLSTDKQVAVEKGSLEQQVNIAISEIVSRSNRDRINYKLSKFFIEPGITGTHDVRPEFNLMQRQIKLGKYKFVVFKEISRLIRNVEIWKKFFRLCIENECEIMIRGLPINPNDPSQILQLDILAAFAEYESNQTSKRTKESNYAAMISSGKFNSTISILGLDPLVVNGDQKVGFYVPNQKELKTVEWIMRTFIKYGSYQRTIEECNKRNIKTKFGNSYTKNSINHLLTNKKYIGKWELNVENKGKIQDKLMPYDRYAEVDLPHGCVVDKSLWDQVQKTVQRISMRNHKNTRLTRIYPLSGLLKAADGTPYHGAGAWGEHNKERINYYHNPKKKLRIVVDALETEAKKIVGEIISNSPKLRDAIKKRGQDEKSALLLLDDQSRKLNLRIDGLKAEKRKLNNRLDFMLEDGDIEDAKKFKAEYKREFARISEEIGRLEENLGLIELQAQEIADDSFDWQKLGENASRIQDVIQENDPGALKAGYRALFREVIVGDPDDYGKGKLKFVLHDGSIGTAVTAAENYSVRGKMVVRARLELATCGL